MSLGSAPDWWPIANAEAVPSPALLVDPQRIEANVRRMLEIAGGPDRLCPHIKTHKLAEVVRLQQAAGIHRFKCATIAEAELLAGCGARQVLLAYQPVGPNLPRLLNLISAFPATEFAAVVDNPSTAYAIGKAATSRGVTVRLLLDIDCGMGRTGLPAGPDAVDLYSLIARLPGIVPGGLHAYDGQVADSNLAARTAAAHAALAPVKALKASLLDLGLSVPRLIAGGTPTFPIHAADPEIECSPGTCLLWDGSYGASFPDLRFQPAAWLLTRVISKPAPHRLCLDLGHKAVAAEHRSPRVALLGLPEAQPVMHSEEHLVIETARAAEFQVGDVLYGLPWHICPTVALHSRVYPVVAGRAAAPWKSPPATGSSTFEPC